MTRDRARRSRTHAILIAAVTCALACLLAIGLIFAFGFTSGEKDSTETESPASETYEDAGEALIVFR